MRVISGGGMEECEICGAKTKDIYIVNVEDVELRVCTKCAKGKKIVSKVVEKKQTGKFFKEKKNEEPQLVENYGTVIHSARESMKIPMKVLAEMLNEKETLLLRIEQQRTLPSMQLAKKIEKALGIKLAEPEQQNEGSSFGGKGDKVTLGDFIIKRKK
jgi:putative transcription factor